MSGGYWASLATWAPRIPDLPGVLRSIAAQTVRPSRIIVAVANEDDLMAVGELAARGDESDEAWTELLEVIQTDDPGPGKKLYPALRMAEGDDLWGILTVDDDAIYDPNLVARYLGAFGPRTVVCAAGSLYQDPEFDADGRLVSLSLEAVTRGLVHVPNGYQGILYPPGLLNATNLEQWSKYPETWHSDDVFVGAEILLMGGRCVAAGGMVREYLHPPGTAESQGPSALSKSKELKPRVMAAAQASGLFGLIAAGHTTQSGNSGSYGW